MSCQLKFLYFSTMSDLTCCLWALGICFAFVADPKCLTHSRFQMSSETPDLQTLLSEKRSSPTRQERLNFAPFMTLLLSAAVFKTVDCVFLTRNFPTLFNIKNVFEKQCRIFPTPGHSSRIGLFRRPKRRFVNLTITAKTT